MSDSDKYYIPKDTFTDLYFETQEPDFDVHVGDEVIKVHKLLLTMYSPILRTMLLECEQDSSFTLTIDCKPKIFKKLIAMLSCQQSVEEIDKEFYFDEYIELINLADYYDIEKLLKPLENGFYEYNLTVDNIYEKYKAIKSKNIKKACLYEIYTQFKDEPVGDLETLLKSITSGDDMVNFYEEHAKIKDCNLTCIVPEARLYSIAQKWRDLHATAQEINIITYSAYYKKLLQIIDLNDFRPDELIKMGRVLYSDFDKKYVNVLLEKVDKYMDQNNKQNIQFLKNLNPVNYYDSKPKFPFSPFK